MDKSNTKTNNQILEKIITDQTPYLMGTNYYINFSIPQIKKIIKCFEENDIKLSEENFNEELNLALGFFNNDPESSVNKLLSGYIVTLLINYISMNSELRINSDTTVKPEEVEDVFDPKDIERYIVEKYLDKAVSMEHEIITTAYENLKEL